MINITSLGGSGEDSRNCYWIKSGTCSILLDCGVRREIATAGVLYELGYRGFVYASKETIGMIPSYLSKWVEYVKQHGGSLPFDKNNIGKIRYKPVDELPFPVRYGRDGHIIGGLWYLFDFDRKTLLYTGDLTYDSLLLEADLLPEADILIIDVYTVIAIICRPISMKNCMNMRVPSLSSRESCCCLCPPTAEGSICLSI